jgi:ribonucleoside-diphosphate reductase alpha chain
MIAHCSNGVEPCYALSFEKRVTVGSFFYTNQELERVLRRNGLYSEALLKKIVDNYGSIKGLDEIPKWIQDTFVTAIDLHWTDHLMAQAIWQRWISNAIAKTINMPNDVTVSDVGNAYLLAHELGLKGVTVYRDGSRHEQVLHIHGDKEKKFSIAPSDYVVDYVSEQIHDPYVREKIIAMFNELAIETYAKQHPHTPQQPQQQPQAPSILPIKFRESRICSIEYASASTPMVDTGTGTSDSNRIYYSDNGHVCPDCNASLVVTEGCKMCLDCGYSACSSS